MRTGSSSVVVIAAFAAFLGLPTAKASVIYQSVPDLTADVAGASSTCSSCGGSSNSAYQVYDAFTLASAAAVDQIEFDAYSPSWNPIFFPTDVSVEIFEYAGPGVIGSLLFSQTFSQSDFVYTFAFTTNDIPATLVAVDPIGLALASGEYYISFYIIRWIIVRFSSQARASSPPRRQAARAPSRSAPAASGRLPRPLQARSGDGRRRRAARARIRD
jgi:hypothetical protein